MTTLTFGLRAIRHPLSLFSIGLLLLNDHFLKTTSPSWFTGKLSDFAGLVFFPLLVVIGLSLPNRLLRLPPRQVLAIACGFTLIWFTLVKTDAWTNTFTETTLAHLLGQPVQIILDPTDLIALPILLLTWHVGIEVERETKPQPPGKISYIALGLATLATIATSPCMPPSHVERLTVYDNTLYTSVSYGYTETPNIVQSQDGGISWTFAPTLTLPAEIAQSLSNPRPLPISACLPSDPLTCYRTSGNEKIEVTVDGGKTWRVAWRTPPGRHAFMERTLSFGPLATCKAPNEIDPGPYDLVMLQQPTGWSLIVASGNEGVLVYASANGWQRYEVFNATPTSYAAKEWIAIPFLLLPELAFAGLLAVLVLFGLSIFSWRIHLRDTVLTLWQFGRVIYPTGVIVLLLLLWLITFLGNISQFTSSPRVTESWHSILYAIAMSVIYPLLNHSRWLWPALGLSIISWAWAWKRVLSLMDDSANGWRTLWICILTSVGLVIGSALPFTLWAWGLIPYYSIALGLACVSGLGAFNIGLRFIRRTHPTPPSLP